LQNSRWAEAMEAGMLETERKHAMADLAQGVAHDVNNALGATIPLLQQVRDDLASGRIDQPTLKQDIEQIEKSVRVCRDIFGGMLRFARTAARPESTASVRSAIDLCLMILRDSLKRRGIAVRIDVPAEVPSLTIGQSELEQVLLNLMTNARDAMPRGGELEIHSKLVEAAVHLEVRDNGCGIAPEHLPHVQDPFFTTKPQGTGLGLSICRSIVWRSHGELKIDSTPGKGTLVLLELPVSTSASAATAAMQAEVKPIVEMVKQ
jgi:two-component system NtrC family sensor kinase